MRVSYFMHLFTAVTTVVFWLVIALLVWSLHRQWWGIRGVRRALWIAPVVLLATIGIWALATWAGWIGVTWPLRFASAAGVIVSLSIMLTLPITGLVLTLERLVKWCVARVRRHGGASVASNGDAPENRGRRSLLATTTAVLPLTLGGTGLIGAINSTSRVVFPPVDLAWANLPPALEGLRILHFTDFHLGYAHDLSDMEQIIDAASTLHADLVLVTGDVADDLVMLPDALTMIASLRPRLGVYATLGNHEYYVGITDVLRAFDRGPVPLLRDESVLLGDRAAPIHLLGIDDPTRQFRAINPEGAPAFLREGIATAIDGGPSQAFRILMSHRPKGFDAACDFGIDLTLAGHTHGGIQLGFRGRSVLEPFFPEQYFWGHYAKGASQLYTSAGVGHWFPFRLGCPMEAPVYTLRRS